MLGTEEVHGNTLRTGCITSFPGLGLDTGGGARERERPVRAVMGGRAASHAHTAAYAPLITLWLQGPELSLTKDARLMEASRTSVHCTVGGTHPSATAVTRQDLLND